MSPQAGWLLVNEIVPRLKSAVPKSVKAVGSEDPEELVQDATAFAAKLLHNVEAAGKQVTAGNITYYTLQHMKSGRRSTGSSRVDVLYAGTQLDGHTEIVSMEDEIPVEDECMTLHDCLSTNTEDPATIATRNLDWDAFCAALSPTRVAVLKGLADGETLREVGNQRQVSDSTLQHHRQRLAVTIREFMGEDILVEAGKMPHWKDGLVANRERVARKRK